MINDSDNGGKNDGNDSKNYKTRCRVLILLVLITKMAILAMLKTMMVIRIMVWWW